MKKTVYTLLTIFMMLLLLPSCIGDYNLDCDSNLTDSKLIIQLSFVKDQTTAQTRAAGLEPGEDSLNEKKINSLNLFFYQGDTLKWKVENSQLTYDAGTNNITIPVRDDIKKLFRNNTTITYDVYMVANNTADLSTITEGADNLQALRDLVLKASDFVTKGGSGAQASFVMEGKISQIINLNNPVLGKINLQRVASKIRLRLMEVNVPGFIYDHVNHPPTAALKHFTDQSALLEGGAIPTLQESDWKNTEARTLSTDAPATLGSWKTTAIPFYAYSNNWQTEPARETYIELTVPLRRENESTVQNYKYHVYVTPQNLTGDDAQYMNRLDRNYLYDIAVSIKIPGGVVEEPVTVTGNYIIKEWDTQNVAVDVQGMHYLVVSERNITMSNIDTYTLTFNSSAANVTIVPNSLKATYTYVPAGGSQPVTEAVNLDQMPAVTVDANTASGNIVINSPIPVNYLPKDIEFEITNGTLTEKVVIHQYAATSFSTTRGVRSSMRSSISNDENPYMYAITSSASGGTFKDGTTPIIWGFPPIDAQGRTINSWEVSNMVSPKFEMASQFGASQRKGYAAAQTQCQQYREYYIDENGDEQEKTGWRLPTAAEIRYIDELQRDANSNIGVVMTAKWYWSSWDSYPTADGEGAYMMIGGSGGSYDRAYVRCIRDIKD